MQMAQTAGNKDRKMKKKLWLLLVTGIAYLPAALAEENKRSHLKCYLQLEDNSKIVHHFVNNDQEDNQFIASISLRSVFMADGVSEKKIQTVYECVDIKNNFKSNEAIVVEKTTPF